MTTTAERGASPFAKALEAGAIDRRRRGSETARSFLARPGDDSSGDAPRSALP